MGCCTKCVLAHTLHALPRPHALAACSWRAPSRRATRWRCSWVRRAVRVPTRPREAPARHALSTACCAPETARSLARRLHDSEQRCREVEGEASRAQQALAQQERRAEAAEARVADLEAVCGGLSRPCAQRAPTRCPLLRQELSTLKSERAAMLDYIEELSEKVRPHPAPPLSAAPASLTARGSSALCCGERLEAQQ